MSEMETHKGKLVPMVLNGGTLEERAKEVCEKFGLEMDSESHDNWVEVFWGEHTPTDVYLDEKTGVFYEVKDQELESYGFVEGAVIVGGSYDYFVSYYNGGAGFNEVMDDAIEEANEAKEKA